MIWAGTRALCSLGGDRVWCCEEVGGGREDRNGSVKTKMRGCLKKKNAANWS